MSIREISLKDSSKASEFFLPEGPARTTQDLVTLKEVRKLQKHNHSCWICSKPTVKPFRVILWEGTRKYFCKESCFINFADKRFLIRTQEYCPICGQKIKSLSISFSEAGSGLPYQLYFCSKDCLKSFMKEYNIYKLLKKVQRGNIDYENTYKV